MIWAKPEFNSGRGSFALTATQIKAVGIGELLARLERLRTALAAEGLFAAARKRRLPFLPGTIGLICGRDSAAERDVLRNAARRWPAVRFRVEQVAVQGPRPAKKSSGRCSGWTPTGRGGDHHRARRRFHRGSAAVLGRGSRAGSGGSVTPVISAIGHEQDVPLLDLVADVRASTPTDAARRAVPDVAEQLELIGQLRSRAQRSVAGRLDAR